MPLVLEERVFNREAMLRFLAELCLSGKVTGSSCFPAELTPGDKEPLLAGLPPQLAEVAITSGTGTAVFRVGQSGYVITPPFPIEKVGASLDEVVETLHNLLETEHHIAVVLLRLGHYAIGLCHGEELTVSKVGTGLVHGRHRQGGSSSARFRRHREKQIETFLTRVCGHLRELLETEARGLDYVIYGGAATTLRLLEKECGFLKTLSGRVLPPLLDIHNPDRAVLDDVVRRLWLSRVTGFREMASSDL